MVILENDRRIERLERNAGVTKPREFSYGYDETIFVPSGVVYHKIITKRKDVVYQTGPQPQKYSKKINKKCCDKEHTITNQNQSYEKRNHIINKVSLIDIFYN